MNNDDVPTCPFLYLEFGSSDNEDANHFIHPNEATDCFVCSKEDVTSGGMKKDEFLMLLPHHFS